MSPNELLKDFKRVQQEKLLLIASKIEHNLRICTSMQAWVAAYPFSVVILSTLSGAKLGTELRESKDNPRQRSVGILKRSLTGIGIFGVQFIKKAIPMFLGAIKNAHRDPTSLESRSTFTSTP